MRIATRQEEEFLIRQYNLLIEHVVKMKDTETIINEMREMELYINDMRKEAELNSVRLVIGFEMSTKWFVSLAELQSRGITYELKRKE